jgi:hypothetical protein
MRPDNFEMAFDVEVRVVTAFDATSINRRSKIECLIPEFLYKLPMQESQKR